MLEDSANNAIEVNLLVVFHIQPHKKLAQKVWSVGVVMLIMTSLLVL